MSVCLRYWVAHIAFPWESHENSIDFSGQWPCHGKYKQRVPMGIFAMACPMNFPSKVPVPTPW